MKKFLILILVILFFFCNAGFVLAEEIEAEAITETVPVKEYHFTYTGFDGINLDDQTAVKGYTMKLFEENFLFGITPNVLTGGGRFEFKEVELALDHNMDLPDGYSVASKIMEFDIKSKDKYNPAKPFWLQVKYDEKAVYEKSIFYFDQGKGAWIMIPSQTNTETGYVRAAFHLPYAKLAVLQNDGIMHQGVASWYAYKDCDCAASPDYPKGTLLRVTNIDNNKEVIVTVNDFGPERDIFPDRVIDLDVVAFKKIADKSDGLCKVYVEPYILDEPESQDSESADVNYPEELTLNN